MHPNTAPKGAPSHTSGVTPRTTGRPWATVGSAAVAIAALALLAAACGGGSGGPGVASAGATTTSPSASGLKASSSSQARAVAFSRCMRSHGVSDFPDPNSQGQISISAASGSDLTPGSPQFQAAMSACKSLAPGGNLTPAQKAQVEAQQLKFSQCMRAHGIADFPDPDSSGRIAIHGTPGGDLDPNSPKFQTAMNACQKDQPKNGPGGGFGIRISSSEAPGNGAKVVP